MTRPADPFAYHPGLLGKVALAEQSRLRAMTPAILREKMAERGAETDWLHSEEEREASRREMLAEHRGDLWVFGYGSLMWDPGLQFDLVRRAHVTGYARRFILCDIYGARGTRAAPGLMAALDHVGGTAGCDGLAFRVPAPLVEAETQILWGREKIGPAYRPVFVTADLGGETVEALTFEADHDAELIAADITRADQLKFCATGTGFLGTSYEYLKNIAEHFEVLGIEDAEVTGLLRDVRAYRETNGG